MSQNVPHGLMGVELIGSKVKLFLEGLQHIHGVGQVIQAQDQYRQVLRLPGQLHGGFGDKPQGAFGPNKQMAKIVAGVVLFQILVQVQDVALTGYHL